MSKYINAQFWRESLSKPDWYLILDYDFKRLEKLAEGRKGDPGYKEIKGEAYELITEAVRSRSLPLAAQGPNLDKERQAIDTIVIHHTKNPSGITLERLNAIQLLRIYGRYYANPTAERELGLKGKLIWSGHFYKGRQVFWGYHWLIREDGTRERILKDEHIGWHAGNWSVNTRSIGICVDDDLTKKEPSDAVISSIAELIKTNYAKVSRANIVGHRDVNKQTACPGGLFHESWRQKVLLKLS